MLFNHWGEEPLADTAARVGRTIPAVRAKLRKIMGSSSALQGRDTVASLANETGYDWHTIRRVMKALGMRPGRTNRKRTGRGRYMLQERHAEAIIAHLGRETADHQPSVTIADVARQVTCSRSWAYRSAKRVGVQAGPLVASDVMRLEVALTATKPQRLTIHAVARNVGAHPRSAYTHARRVGIGPGPLSEAEADYLAATLWRQGLAA